MYDSFETLFLNIWGSLDDVFICVTMAIVLRVISRLLDADDAVWPSLLETTIFGLNLMAFLLQELIF